MVAFIIALVLFGIALFVYFKYFKLLKMKNILFIDGSLGTGKSFLSVSLAVRRIKKSVRFWHYKIWLLTALSFIPKFKDRLSSLMEEKPVLCSNIQISNYPFVLLTKEILYREKRLPFKSVVLIDEYSLVADQMMYKDNDLNNHMTAWWKLFRHELHGGFCIVNSQSTSDISYHLKYVLSDYLYIHHRTRLPFFSVLKVQEMVYCGDRNGASIVQVSSGDVEENLKIMFVRNKYFKYFDSYCYSIFTDDLEKDTRLRYKRKGDNLKLNDIVSFKDLSYLQSVNDKKHILEVVKNEDISA